MDTALTKINQLSEWIVLATLTALFFEFCELRIVLGQGTRLSPSWLTPIQWLCTKQRENNEQIVESVALSHCQDLRWFETHYAKVICDDHCG